MDKYIVSENKEIILDGKKYLLEAGDEITINTQPVLYFDLDETLIHQSRIPCRPIEKPVAEIDGYTIWKRPGADEAIKLASSSFREIHIYTAGKANHQQKIVNAVFPGFPGTVYARDFDPPTGKPWILIDNEPGGAQIKSLVLGEDVGTHVHVKSYMPVCFNKFAEKQGKTQQAPENGNTIVSAVREAIKLSRS